MKTSLLGLFAVLLAGCQQIQSGYKIVSYSQPAGEAQPEFIIFHKDLKIVAKCDNYYGSHVSCDQLKSLVGTIIPETKMRYTLSDIKILVYSPDGRTKDCGQYGPCEFLRISKTQSTK